MDYNLFENLYKYKETENKSQLENFLTELFVYVLKSLIFQRNELVVELLNDKFHIPFTKDDFDKIEIETQIRYNTSEGYYPQPDISLIINKCDLYLIESKVESSLNQYNDIDQIQLYERVITDSNLKGVRTLTKYEIYTKKREEYTFFDAGMHKVFWYQIYELLNDKKYCLSDNILVQNFLIFLEDHNMGKQEQLIYIENGLENFYSLYNFLNKVITDFANRGNYGNVRFLGNEDYFGFEILYNKTVIMQIGLFKSSKDTIVVETLADENILIKSMKKNWNVNLTKKTQYEHTILAELDLDKLVKQNSFEAQQKVFDEWIQDKHVDRILQISGEIIKGNWGTAIIEDLLKSKILKDFGIDFVSCEDACGIIHQLNDDISLVFWNDGCNTGYGFYSKSEKLRCKEYKDRIQSIMKSKDLDCYSEKFSKNIEIGYNDDKWAVRLLNLEEMKSGEVTYPELFDNIIEKLKFIKKKF